MGQQCKGEWGGGVGGQWGGVQWGGGAVGCRRTATNYRCEARGEGSESSGSESRRGWGAAAGRSGDEQPEGLSARRWKEGVVLSSTSSSEPPLEEGERVGGEEVDGRCVRLIGSCWRLGERNLVSERHHADQQTTTRRWSMARAIATNGEEMWKNDMFTNDLLRRPTPHHANTTPHVTRRRRREVVVAAVVVAAMGGTNAADHRPLHSPRRRRLSKRDGRGRKRYVHGGLGRKGDDEDNDGDSNGTGGPAEGGGAHGRAQPLQAMAAETARPALPFLPLRRGSDVKTKKL